MDDLGLLHDLIRAACVLIESIGNHQARQRNRKLVADHLRQWPCGNDQIVGARRVQGEKRLERFLIHVVGRQFLGIVVLLAQHRPERLDVLSAYERHRGNDLRFRRHAEINAGVLHQDAAQRLRRLNGGQNPHHWSICACVAPACMDEREAICQRRPEARRRSEAR